MITVENLSFTYPKVAEPALMPLSVLKNLSALFGQYDPARQVVVIFDEIENSAADASVPTFIFEFPDNDS